MTRRSPAPRVRPRARPRAAVGCLLAVVALASPAVAGPVSFAASPSPAVLGPSVEAWLDARFEPPPDIPDGAPLMIGVTFWDRDAGQLVPVDGVFARLRPAKGEARPTTADAVADWPGHVLIELPAPRGGAGELRLGIHGPDGDRRLSVAGTGPPPDAPRASLVTAMLLPVVGDVVAGRPFLFGVNVVQRGLWDAGQLDLPRRLVVTAGPPGEPAAPPVAETELEQAVGEGAPYLGELTFPDVGDVELTVAFPTQGGADQVVAGPPILVTVVAGGREEPVGSSRPRLVTPEGAESDGIPTVVWAVLGGLLVVALLLMFGGQVAGRMRRRDR